MTYRVWMHTSPGPGSTFYSGYVDVTVDADASEDDVAFAARRKAYAGAGHTGLVVDRIERRF